MYPSSTYVGLRVVPIYKYFGAKVYTIWVHGPLGLGFSCSMAQGQSIQPTTARLAFLELAKFLVWVQGLGLPYPVIPEHTGDSEEFNIHAGRFRFIL